MKQAAHFSLHFIVYMAMAIMLLPNKVSTNSTITKQASKKVQVTTVSVQEKEENFKEDLLFRF